MKKEQTRELLDFIASAGKVAEGLYDGGILLIKDSFPAFAGSHIVNQAGLIATNFDGSEDIKPNNRVFICGNKYNYKALMSIVKETIEADRNF